MLFVRAKRGGGSAGSAPHLRRGVPQEERAVRAGGVFVPQEVPYLRTQRRTPERRADAATEALRPVKGHGGAALDGGGLPAGVREVLFVRVDREERR